MTLFSKRSLIAAALATAFVGLSATASAQSASSGPAVTPESHAQHTAQGDNKPGHGKAMDPARQAEMQKRMAEHHAKRMAQLKAELKITATQESAWNAFATQPKHEPRGPMAGEDWSKLTTPQRLDKMQARKAERDAEMGKHIEATRNLYAALTPEQQKTFDAQRPGNFHPAGMKGEHRMGGKAGHHGMSGMGGGMH